MTYLRTTRATWDLDLDGEEGRALLERIRTDGAAVFRAQPGFIRYRLMAAGPRRTVAVAEWASEELGRRGAERFRDWLDAAGIRARITMDTDAGPVVATADAKLTADAEPAVATADAEPVGGGAAPAGGGAVRAAFPAWPRYQAALRSVVAGLTDEQLAIRPAPDRWPLWATIGHLACQRVSWLCGFAGEPGGDATPFPDALYRCPGDEYLEPAMNAAELVGALDATFAVVEGVLDRWTTAELAHEIVRDFDGDVWRHTRGWVLGRVFAHDVAHVAEINEILGGAGLPGVDLWD